MKTLLRKLLAVITGLALALVLVIAVEVFSSIVYPLPKDFNQTMEAMCQHVARYPHWVLGVVVILWSGTVFVSTWVATKIGRIAAGVAVSLILLWAVAFNLWMLPYTPWFKVVMPIGCLVACLLGVRLGGRVSGTAATADERTSTPAG